MSVQALKQILLLSLLLCVFGAAQADSVTVRMYSTEKARQSIGTVLFKDTAYGALIIPKLYHVPPGPHGFHLHQKPHCARAGKAAGGHFDPKNTNRHRGPYHQKRSFR